MQRFQIPARENWPAIVESQGFPFHSFGKRPEAAVGTYWYEGAYYALSLDEVNVIEKATEELHARCLDAVAYVVKRPELMSRLQIPMSYHDMVKNSWDSADPSLYGRFDLAFDGVSAPKLLEYNADTPTTLVESSVVQWFWLKDQFLDKGKKSDQFNSIHEKLIDRLKEILPGMKPGKKLFFSALKDNLEEFATVEYLRDLAVQAGFETEFIYLEDVGWNEQWGKFVDLNENPIDYWFKLYPWEWIAGEEFGKHMPRASETMGIIEPPWKMVLSNKGILPILWQLFPEHPNLLPSFWAYDPILENSFVEKPMLGREGGNIKLTSPQRKLEVPGPYDGQTIFQGLFKLPVFDENYMTLGSWVIGDRSAGICVREDDQPIIINRSRLVPHLFQ